MRTLLHWKVWVDKRCLFETLMHFHTISLPVQNTVWECYPLSVYHKINKAREATRELPHLEDLGSDSITSNHPPCWSVLQHHTAGWTSAPSSQQRPATRRHIIIIKISRPSRNWLKWFITLMSAALGLPHCWGWCLGFRRRSCSIMLQVPYS